ncbi:MAG: Rieske 2Fe-2S domain-containing protein [Acidobacteria bacterium]|nr:Rieske 2Fe-2S domain-containing protein [Acidobacteriota bacterium]
MAEMIRVASLDEMTETMAVCLNHRDIPYCVIKSGDTVQAFIAVCPHENKVMNPPLVLDGCLVCPFHKVAFDATSGAVREARNKRLTKGLSPVQTGILAGVVYLQAQIEHQSFAPLSKWQRFIRIFRRFGLRATSLGKG